MGTRRKFKSLFLAVLCLILFATVSARLAVMSIDLGGEFMKIAIVKPGVPMEIVLNKESSRKTPTLVAFRDGERHFGNQAQNTAVKFPAKAFAYLPLIVGKQFDDPQVQLFRQRFPYYTMEKDAERGTVVFKTEDDSTYSVEEMLAMILDKAREYAQDFAEQEIRDAVITVPCFFNQAERRAVMASAQMVGINVLQLMSDNAAVALNYGVFRRNNFNTTSQFYMFYDMGATSTTATIVGYNVVKAKEGLRVESNPQLTIKGVGFDRTLGGLEITIRLRDSLAKIFDGQKKTSMKVFDSPRAMAKLFKEAERVKKVLSANNDHSAQVEGLLDEKDFRSPVTRAELEHMSEDLFERLTKPIEEALKVSEITLPEINEVILMGGGTRIPKVQEILMKYLGRSDLGKSINTDEAAAMGAVYQAAYLGKGFKVKKFGVREGNIYPINVEFEKQRSEESEEPARLIKRTLFNRMNPFPQRKVMTFNKHTKDFGFQVSYGGLEFLTEDDKRSFENLYISKHQLVGVADALTKNKDVAESKGIKAHFHMDESGLLSLDKVESIFEKNDTAELEKSTWSKLGSAIGGLFGSGSEDTKVEDSSEEETPEGNADETTDDKKEEKPARENQESEKEKTEDATDKAKEQTSGDEEKADKAEKDEKKADETGDKKDEKEKKDGEKKEGEEKKEEEKEKVPKIVNVKEIIKSEAEVLDVPDLSEERFTAAKKRLTDLRKADQEKVELEKAHNELESFIFDTRDRLYQEDYEKCSTTEEREGIQQKLSEASDWLEEVEGGKKSEYKEKLTTLKDAMKALAKRVYELQERPKALEALRSALNQTTVFLSTIKNLTSLPGAEALEGEQIFTPVEVETLEKTIVDTRNWRDDILKEQEKLKDTDEPLLLVEDVGQKINSLDREMRYLINKAKNYKPKPKVKPAEKKEGSNDTKSEKTEGEAETTAEETTEGEQVPPPQDGAEPEAENAQQEKKEEEGAAEKKTEEPKPEKDDNIERTSSGKRRPKQKRKATKEAEEKKAAAEEPLEIEGAYKSHPRNIYTRHSDL